jgi:drug/metabolite transporter (DMT)-like permease
MDTNNPRGIALIIAAMMLFVGNDALMKIANEFVTPAQAIFVRGWLVTVLLFAIAIAQGQLSAWRELAQRDVLLRAALEGAGSYGYLFALAHLPLAIALAINMSVPLMILPFAVIILAERVGWRRWSALLVGFCGVLLIVKPGPEGVDWWAMLALVSTVAHAMRDVVTRRIPVAVPSVLITALSATVLGIGSGGVVLYEGWHPVPTTALISLAFAAVMVTAAMYLLVVGTRIGEASVIAGFRYSAMVWGIVVGYAIWGYLPDTAASIGIALIIGAGLYAAHRERLRRSSGAAPSGRPIGSSH